MPPTKAQMQKIHIAKKELGLSDELYRDILHVNFKAGSSKELNTVQAARLLDIFAAKGWQAKRGKESGKSPRYEDRQHRKILAMWITLHQAGVVRSGSDKALQAYVKRQTGIDNLKWCDGGECHKLIESLKKWGQREDVAFDE